MVRIIRGKRYNTETATLIAEYWNGAPLIDSRYVCESLYLTKKGNWFLHYKGGALSYWAKSGPQPTSTVGGEDIMSFDPLEAREWLEEHRQTEALEQYFGADLEGA